MDENVMDKKISARGKTLFKMLKEQFEFHADQAEQIENQ
jgi:hypothetical protein